MTRDGVRSHPSLRSTAPHITTQHRPFLPGSVKQLNGRKAAAAFLGRAVQGTVGTSCKGTDLPSVGSLPHLQCTRTEVPSTAMRVATYAAPASSVCTLCSQPVSVRAWATCAEELTEPPAHAVPPLLCKGTGTGAEAGGVSESVFRSGRLVS